MSKDIKFAMSSFEKTFKKTPQNSVARIPKRGVYDKQEVYDILDAALICTVSFVVDGQPFAIPTIHARHDDKLLLHGSSKSRLMMHAAEGHDLCVSVTHLDGLVLARSSFHHSMNYRSAVVFGKGQLVEAESEKNDALAMFTDKLVPGRWDDARKPTSQELKATLVVSIPIDSASAKVRTGGPVDDDEDYALDVWAGVVPIQQTFLPAEADDKLSDGIAIPEYLREYIDNNS